MSGTDLTGLLPALRSAGIVPVITIDDAARAVPLARALVEAGLPVLEVTLRTEAALSAIRRIADAVPGAIVGAGTLRRPVDIETAVGAGARFLVSPGATHELVRAARAGPVPFLPGCSTASEAMALADAGFEVLKFFPASSSGGPAALRALGAPLADVSFVPTGGIGPDDLEAYLGLSNVVAVGGSWMVRPTDIAAGRFEAIGEAARAAAEAVRTARS